MKLFLIPVLLLAFYAGILFAGSLKDQQIAILESIIQTIPGKQ